MAAARIVAEMAKAMSLESILTWGSSDSMAIWRTFVAALEMCCPEGQYICDGVLR